LKGLTPDANTNTAAMALRATGVPLTRVAVVSDDQDDIIKEIQRMQDEVDVVITSGGVGPTHDDVTIKSIASALEVDMLFNTEMAQLLKEKMSSGKRDDDNDDDAVELTDAQVKMATLPACAKLRYFKKDEWPVLQCKNIFILPGVPQFFAKKVEALASHLSNQLERRTTYKVVLSVDENSIVSVLNSVVERHPNVSIGSYPFVSHPDYKTVVTMESRTMEGGYARNSGIFLDRRNSGLSSESVLFSRDQMDMHVEAALADLIHDLPTESVLRVDNNDDLRF